MFEPLYDLLMSDVDYEALFHEVKSYLQSTDFVIDAGCGSGYFLIELLRHGYTAIGIDVSSKMLSIAENRLRENNVSARLYEHDLRNALHAQADVIIMMFDVINYFKGAKKVFKNVINSLYPGGRLIFDVYQENVLDEYNGYHEVESEPMEYQWEIECKGSMMKHQVIHDMEVDVIYQYVYPIDYYVNILKSYGLEVEVKATLDPRKYLVIATKL